MAAAGLGSRRACEELIREGRVEVDRQVVTELGHRVDPLKQEIRVDGDSLPRPKRQYFLVHKPPGVLSTNRDPAGRARVIDLLPSGSGHLFTVGRLDRSSEGLILVTNDGELAERLTHPRYEVPKIYQVLVAGVPTTESLERLQQGIHLAEGWARVDRLRVVKQRKQSTQLELVLREGRNREIRRILARVGHKVLKLRRVGLGPLKLADLAPGASRRLAPSEVQALWQASETERLRPQEAPPPRPAKPPAGPAKSNAARDTQSAPEPTEAAPTGSTAPQRERPSRPPRRARPEKPPRRRRPKLLVSGGQVLDWQGSADADWQPRPGAKPATAAASVPGSSGARPEGGGGQRRHAPRSPAAVAGGVAGGPPRRRKSRPAPPRPGSPPTGAPLRRKPRRTKQR